MHVLAFVCLLVCSDIGHGCGENFMFWGELVLGVFGWFFLLWFLGLFAETAEILLRLAWVLGIVLLALGWRLALLSFGWRLAFHSAFFILLALFTLLWLFFLLFGLVFGRHGIKHSRRFLGFLSIDKGRDIDDFSFILVEPSQWNLQVGVSSSVPKIVGLHDTGDKLRGDLWFGFFLDWLFGNFASYFVNFLKVAIVLSHFVPDFALVPALLYKSTLLLVPFKDFTQSLYLILTSFNLSKIRYHGMQFLIGKHFVGISDRYFFDPFIVLIEVVDNILELILRFEERVVGKFNIQDKGSRLDLLDEFLEVVSVLFDSLLVGK
jgi:hypothetical protein